MSTIVKVKDFNSGKLNNYEFAYFSTEFLSLVQATTAEKLHVAPNVVDTFAADTALFTDFTRQTRISDETAKIADIDAQTDDLIINIIEKTGYKLDRVEINDVEKETYYATLYLVDENGKTVEIDSRPSDAIAVAIRVDAPIFVTANVISSGSVSTDSAKDEEEAQEFKNFVQSLKPSDFEKLLKDNDHHESDQ